MQIYFSKFDYRNSSDMDYLLEDRNSSDMKITAQMVYIKIIIGKITRANLASVISQEPLINE